MAAVFHAYHMSPAAAPLAAPDGPAFVADAEGHVHLTAERFLSVLRRALAAAGVDSRQYGLHSFRRGGAAGRVIVEWP